MAARRAEHGIPQASAARHALARLGRTWILHGRSASSRGRRGIRNRSGESPPFPGPRPDTPPTRSADLRSLRPTFVSGLHPRRTGRATPSGLPDAGDDPRPTALQADGFPYVCKLCANESPGDEPGGSRPSAPSPLISSGPVGPGAMRHPGPPSGRWWTLGTGRPGRPPRQRHPRPVHSLQFAPCQICESLQFDGLRARISIRVEHN